jgi:hypothetical protein
VWWCVPVIPAIAGIIKEEDYGPCWPGQEVRPSSLK